MDQVHITIFQAPIASLMEHGLYQKMHDFKHPYQGTVPAEYYLVVFNGSVDCPKDLSEDRETRDCEILERVFAIFNISHPTGYCGRSLSVSDVVEIEDRYYLCAVCGFNRITFTTSPERTIDHEQSKNDG